MTARILVVDDIPANVKLLEARLRAEYFEVLTANSGQGALAVCEREHVDVVLLDVMMPGMDGYETCRRIKANVKTQDLPVVMVTALDQSSDQLAGLEAGADDFLTKPVDDIALITRVKNLARLKTLNDEMNLRASTGQQLGYGDGMEGPVGPSEAQGKVLLVEDNTRSAERLVDALDGSHDVSIQANITQVPLDLGSNDYDVMIVSLALSNADALRLCSQVRSMDRIRHTPIIMIADSGDEARLLRGLDMGVNDYIKRPVERNELLARLRTQIKRKRYSDFLRNRLEESVELAITDPLTGLHNRRYMQAHLSGLVTRSIEGGAPLSLLIADIDHFKQINDTYGHDVGDAVLAEFANRFRENTRTIDLVCRFGGEEFILVMPGVDFSTSYQIAERLLARVAEKPFRVSSELSVPITASVGLSAIESASDTPEILFKRADNALYAAKRAGRNRVMSEAA